MSYVGQSLAPLFGAEAQAETRLAVRRMTAKGVDRAHDFTAANTPVETGNLRTSWYQEPVKAHVVPGGREYVGAVASDVDYAPYVEYGTGLWGPRHAKYPIPNAFGRGFTVMHPGSPGNHMLEIGLHMAEAEAFDGPLFDGILAEWVRGVEAQAR